LQVVVVLEDAMPHGKKISKVREIAEEGDVTRTKEVHCRKSSKLGHRRT
jgi:hypothetical protein